MHFEIFAIFLSFFFVFFFVLDIRIDTILLDHLDWKLIHIVRCDNSFSNWCFKFVFVYCKQQQKRTEVSKNVSLWFQSLVVISRIIYATCYCSSHCCCCFLLKLRKWQRTNIFAGWFFFVPRMLLLLLPLQIKMLMVFDDAKWLQFSFVVANTYYTHTRTEFYAMDRLFQTQQAREIETIWIVCCCSLS